MADSPSGKAKKGSFSSTSKQPVPSFPLPSHAPCRARCAGRGADRAHHRPNRPATRARRAPTRKAPPAPGCRAQSKPLRSGEHPWMPRAPSTLAPPLSRSGRISTRFHEAGGQQVAPTRPRWRRRGSHGASEGRRRLRRRRRRRVCAWSGRARAESEGPSNGCSPGTP